MDTGRILLFTPSWTKSEETDTTMPNDSFSAYNNPESNPTPVKSAFDRLLQGTPAVNPEPKPTYSSAFDRLLNS